MGSSTCGVARSRGRLVLHDAEGERDRAHRRERLGQSVLRIRAGPARQRGARVLCGLLDRWSPTLAEARAFVDEFAVARGAAFTADERRLCGGASTYACACTARCGHACGADERDVPGTLHHLAWTEGANLLTLAHTS
jgi:hypothetical protein